MMESVMRSVGWVRPVRLPNGMDARFLLQGAGCSALDPYLNQADETALLAALMKAAPTLARFHHELCGELV